MRILYGRDIECECGVPGCTRGLDIALPEWDGYMLIPRSYLLGRVAGGIRSPQDPRR